MLFTDNESGLLCLGSDMPAGSTQRLSRKFVCEPPESLPQKAMKSPPSVYATQSDLTGGVRIAAGYGDNVVVYSISIDALKYSTAEQESTLLDSAVPFEVLETMNVLKHPTSNARAIQESASESGEEPWQFDELNMLWVHYLHTEKDVEATSIDELWPIKIFGTHIGSIEALSALSIRSTAADGMIVWAFSKSGAAKTWQINI